MNDSQPKNGDINSLYLKYLVTKEEFLPRLGSYKPKMILIIILMKHKLNGTLKMFLLRSTDWHKHFLIILCC